MSIAPALRSSGDAAPSTKRAASAAKDKIRISFMKLFWRVWQPALSRLGLDSFLGVLCLDFFFLVLQLIELVVDAAQSQQLLMGSRLAQLCFVHHQNSIGALNG